MLDLRLAGSLGTGLGRTSAELLRVLAPTDVVIRPPSPGGEAARWFKAFHAIHLSRLPGVVIQPWTFGPVGSAGTLMGIYDLIPLRLGGAKAHLCHRRLDHLARSPHVEHVVTLSRDTARRLRADYGFSVGITVAHPGIDHIGEPPDVEQPDVEQPAAGSTYALAVGRISPHKNLQMLVEAWWPVRDTISLRLVLPPSDAASQLARRWRSRGVRIDAALSDLELWMAMRDARVVCCPSLEEGFGLPLYEAVAAGVPVIASDIPAFREVTARGVLFLAPTDRPAWSEALRLPPASTASFADVKPTWAGWRAAWASAIQGLRRH